VSEARRLEALEDENRRLKKLLAEAVLDVAAQGPAGKKLSSPAARCSAELRLMAERGLSQRHVLQAARGRPKTVRRLSGGATKRCGRVCARSPASGAASATGGPGSCSSAKA
jgi:hypothetical protein